MAAGVGACWTLDQMVATLEPLRQLPTMPEPEPEPELQLELTLSGLCADYEYARSLGKMCSDSCPPLAATSLPCARGKPTHTLFCSSILHVHPKVCFVFC